MGRVETDTWFFSDKRYRVLIAEERLVLLLIALHVKATTGVLSSKSGLVHETIHVITDRLTSTGLIGRDADFFYLVTKTGKPKSEVAIKLRDNAEYLQILEHLFDTINSMKPEGTKKLKPKSSDYDSIRLMIERDKIPAKTIVGIISIYPTIPFWGEKSIIQSASGLRKHWSRIYESAQKHYNRNRIEKI